MRGCRKSYLALGCRAGTPMSVCGRRSESRFGGDSDCGGQRTVRIDCTFAHQSWLAKEE